jgi:hypothetical protein
VLRQVKDLPRIGGQRPAKSKKRVFSNSEACRASGGKAVSPKIKAIVQLLTGRLMKRM